MQITRLNQFNNKYCNINKNQTQANHNKIYNNICENSLNSNPIAHLNKNNIAFCAMKKSQFQGIDLIMVNQLKAPIQKFSSNSDFQNYCQNILDSEFYGDNNIEKLSNSSDKQAQAQKSKILKDWIDYISKENDAYNPAIQLLIISSITKNLSPNTNQLPPILNKRKLADTIQEIVEKSKTTKNYQPNFDKIYRANLQKTVLENETQLDSSLNGWIIIPSKAHDEANFSENVKKLQILSHDSWCTKTYNAEPYLAKGDFHVYFEQGKPKLGVRFEDDKVAEIQGERNSGKIPLKYLDMVKKYILDKNYKLNSSAELTLIEAQEHAKKVAKIEKEIGLEAIKNKEYEKILPYFGIKAKKDEDGMLILSHFEQPYGELDFEDLGIDENELFRQVIEIENDADFEDSIVTSLGSLKRIKGEANFSYSNITSLGNLEKIEGNIQLEDGKIKSLGNLKYIGGNADFTSCQLNSLGNLEIINGDANFNNSEIISLGNLRKIGGNADFNFSKINSFGNLEYIGGNADFNNSEIESLGNLKKIGGNADFSHSKIKSLGNLIEIGGNADFSNSEIISLGNLRKIGGNADFSNSSITSLGDLRSIGKFVTLNDSQIVSLNNLERIGGDVDFRNSNVSDLGKLKSIGKKAYFYNSNISDLGNLEYIGDTPYFNNSQLKIMQEKLEKFANKKEYTIDDIKEILKIMLIEYEYNEEDNSFAIGRYNSMLTFGVNEDSLFKHIKEIKGNADFQGCSATSLGNIEKIAGNVNFKYSDLISLGNLHSIEGNVDFEESKITSLDNLEYIGGEANFAHSNVQSLGNLKIIGSKANFRFSKLTSLGNLEEIRGRADLSESEITSLGKLREIQGHVFISPGRLHDNDFKKIKLSSISYV